MPFSPKKAILIYGVYLLALIFLTSCGDVNHSRPKLDPVAVQKELLVKIQRETHLVFPDGSKLAQFTELTRSVDPVWVAKVIVPKTALEGLQAELLNKAIDSPNYRGNLTESLTWWKPENVVIKRSCLADRQTFVNVIITKEAEHIGVYIECAFF